MLHNVFEALCSNEATTSSSSSENINTYNKRGNFRLEGFEFIFLDSFEA